MSSTRTAATFCATLVDEWIHLGVNHAVIAPGSRSTPMALALSARTELQIHIFHDERAASFAALGIGLLGLPAILLCTSGTAAAHFHAAVVEAHQAGVPMIVCTADRPPELRDVGAAQTIDQIRLYGTAARWFCDPGVADDQQAPTWRAIAQRCVSEATGTLPGPVHLNLPFREPLMGIPDALPQRRPTLGPALHPKSQSPTAPAVDDLLAAMVGHRGVIVAGRGCGAPRAVAELANALGWPVLADARSGLRHARDCVVAAFDALLRDSTFAEWGRPEVALRLGEPPVSKVLNAWLLASSCPQFRLSSTPRVIDPDAVIGATLVGDVTTLCGLMTSEMSANGMTSVQPSWQEGWLRAEARAQESFTRTVGMELSEPAVARTVSAALGADQHLVVSSSMPIRDVEWFGVIAEGVTVHSNRGANGIDGVIATSVGVALCTRQPTTLLIGDVAFLHDSSALIGLARRQIDLRIVVVNNDGGGIFSFLAQSDDLPAADFEQLFGTPHGVQLELLVAAHGLRYAKAINIAQLGELLNEPGPGIIEVRTDRSRNVAIHQQLNAAVAAAITGE